MRLGWKFIWYTAHTIHRLSHWSFPKGMALWISCMPTFCHFIYSHIVIHTRAQATKAIWDLHGVYCTSRWVITRTDSTCFTQDFHLSYYSDTKQYNSHIPGVKFAGLIHPGVNILDLISIAIFLCVILTHIVIIFILLPTRFDWNCSEVRRDSCVIPLLVHFFAPN